ncbi:hypothetical protein SS1G_06659 [Sclerotinia sclerotiorum 1980 UF-70]|uniref:Uncharacterized protein n=2 Tax=Sclerotinia sclerotiorum (strain ATCC 18683 / 1980 / Ss-1) TaxID=665079 RepID=A0A1D9QIA8_SCLS1|nr:hypothetical protein SS1G_06659 [Sclerotinia sclerotiorum 1980 UF-70]APA14666.1 hypothetical protein sscle_13g094360 [Sclerotinia sclerotiorum 1980 UF-70]EDO04176.1 hypothetical protein SS1G_06659 [Sclerotinia sclerotiorum 1980 UF-70]
MATSTLRPSTPPPSTSLKTPSTPRFGYDDNYEPYSPRKSSRVASRAIRNAVTPPPPTIKQNIRNNLSTPQSTPRAARKVVFSGTPQHIHSSQPKSPQTAIKRRAPRSATSIEGRQVSGALNLDNTTSAATALGLTPKSKKREHKMDHHQRPGTMVRGDGMLPTPSKTPRHPKQTEELKEGINAVSRTLFTSIHADNSADAMPKPKKSRKRFDNYGLDSSSVDEPIAIFTDSEDRIPEVDSHSDNPFFGSSPPQNTRGRSRKPKLIHVPGEEDQTMEQLMGREDGHVANFRGKLIFKKKSNVSTSHSPTRSGGRAEVMVLDQSFASESIGPVTRSCRRQLFTKNRQPPAIPQVQVTEDEEEALTDIEEKFDTDATDTDIEARTPFHIQGLLTPDAPRFGPTSSTTIKRATRATKRYDVVESPVTPPRRGRSQVTSPFKSSGSDNNSERAARKRDGEAAARPTEEVKRARN